MYMCVLFTNSPGDLGSITGRVISKTMKMVLNASLLKTQHYNVRIKGKVGQSRKRNSVLPFTFVWKLSKRNTSGHPQRRSPNLSYIYIYIYSNIYVYKSHSYIHSSTYTHIYIQIYKFKNHTYAHTHTHTHICVCMCVCVCVCVCISKEKLFLGL